MKLKRICKITYDANDVAIIPPNESWRYDIYFIDNEDWMCIDEDDYEPAKFSKRILDKDEDDVLKKRMAVRLNGYKSSSAYDLGVVFAPYIPLNIK